jgi:hypothetical protein
MQEKIHQILSEAKDFMTAEEVAKAGQWRSQGNVTVAIRHMAKVPGQIVSRKSKTKMMLNGHPDEEFALAEKDFAKKHVEDQAKKAEKEQARKAAKAAEAKAAKDAEANADKTKKAADPIMPTDKECCNAAKVVATTAGAEVSALRNQLADAGEVIANARNALSLKEGDSLVLAIQKLISDRNSHRDDVLNWERTMDKLVGTDSLKYVVETIKGMQGRLAALEKSLTEWAGVGADNECKSPAELRVFINALVKRVNDLKATLKSGPMMIGLPKPIEITPMSGNYYAVYRQSRGLQRFKKLETAKVEAEVGARVDGKAELYVMHLVDVANVGAVWNGEKAA